MRARVLRAPPPPNISPKMSPKMSLMDAPPANPASPNGEPFAKPNRSYLARRSGSERTSYASLASLNRSSASSLPGFLSGWYWWASLR